MQSRRDSPDGWNDLPQPTNLHRGHQGFEDVTSLLHFVLAAPDEQEKGKATLVEDLSDSAAFGEPRHPGVSDMYATTPQREKR